MRDAVHSDVGHHVAQRPGNPQLADQVKDKVDIYGDVGPTTPYFDVLAFKSVTDVRFGNAAFNSLRGPGCSTST
jgi:hypothetical protein